MSFIPHYPALPSELGGVIVTSAQVATTAWPDESFTVADAEYVSTMNGYCEVTWRAVAPSGGAGLPAEFEPVQRIAYGVTPPVTVSVQTIVCVLSSTAKAQDAASG